MDIINKIHSEQNEWMIYEDENLRKELSKKGIERAQKFNWESAVPTFNT